MICHLRWGLREKSLVKEMLIIIKDNNPNAIITEDDIRDTYKEEEVYDNDMKKTIVSKMNVMKMKTNRRIHL